MTGSAPPFPAEALPALPTDAEGSANADLPASLLEANSARLKQLAVARELYLPRRACRQNQEEPSCLVR